MADFVCHKSKQLRAGAPLKALASVRSLFIAQPHTTLSMTEKKSLSQAEYFDPAFPGDSQFVENLVWEDSKVVFVTVSLPGGSNNDTSPWTFAFSDPVAQAQEVADRADANRRWLHAAFDMANVHHANAVALKADMWDSAALVAAGGAGLDQYTPFVQELADLSVRLGRAVLLPNVHTHLYFADHPLADPSGATGVIHLTQAVPNLTRITVQGSTNAPSEWLRLVVDPRRPQVVSWQKVLCCTKPCLLQLSVEHRWADRPQAASACSLGKGTPDPQTNYSQSQHPR
jgi:hypothetical protein